MSFSSFKDHALDNIIKDMVQVVETSKDEIFNISEHAHGEYEQLALELEETKKQVGKYIYEGDELEQRVKSSRQQLSKVSQYFDHFSEEEIRMVYERTHEEQTKLAILRQEEKRLRNRRDELERRILSLDQMIERAEGLASKVSVILNYLNDDFQQVNHMIEEAKEKQAFGLKIIEAQEVERKKLSREIHDGPAQMLANILLRSELVDRAYRDQNVETALKEMKDIRKMIRSSLLEVRRIIYDLRPMALDDLGLVPTIKKYISTISDYNDVKIEFNSLGKSERLENKYEIAFFRLMQEAIQNAINHANPTLIQVTLEMTDDRLLMVIKDNGNGFDQAQKKESSFGLIGMRERVEVLDGDIKIESKLGQGTRVFINVPNAS